MPNKKIIFKTNEPINMFKLKKYIAAMIAST